MSPVRQLGHTLDELRVWAVERRLGKLKLAKSEVALVDMFVGKKTAIIINGYKVLF